MHAIKLRHMSCPGCSNRVEVTKLKLFKGAQFSNLTYHACKEISNTRSWRCDCKQLWHKCSIHVKGSEDHVPQPSITQRRRTKFVKKGVDKPLPKLRCIEGNVIDVGSSRRDDYRISLPQGSRLALRFPHLVKRVGGQSNVPST